MNKIERIGIIDIGSNSIRLAIYEETDHTAHRIIEESKDSARLSQKIRSDDTLPDEDIGTIVQTLNHFKMLCEANQTAKIRAVATAAIRNARNSTEIIDKLQKGTGLDIEILSGSEEARLGFLGTINTIDIEDGFLIDIGGGSTEVTLFHNRAIVNSISFPFGSVNTTKKFTREGELDESDCKRIKSMVVEELMNEPWIASKKGLTLIGLGGTIRSIGKLDQRRKNYSLPLTHNYEMEAKVVDLLVEELSALPVEKRKKLEGLSKDRADIIVPGLLILQTIFHYIEAVSYRISGSGLREGLYFETISPKQPKVPNVLKYSVRNLLSLHPSVPLQHVEQVNKIALKLFDDLQTVHEYGPRIREFVDVASLLYRIGVTVLYYEYAKHTFYLMAHSRIDGLSHREILICALSASYKHKHRTRKMCLEYKDILTESDGQLIIKLGTLLQLAIALDRSETQPVQEIIAIPKKNILELNLKCTHLPMIEWREIQNLQRDFQREWNLQIVCEQPIISTK